MPRPTRSKVASTNPRVVVSPSKELEKSKESTTSMATQKTRKGRPPGKKLAEKTAPVAKETVPAATNARPRGRMQAKRVVADESQKGALDALRARRDAALNGKNANKSPVAHAEASTAIARKQVEKIVHSSSTPAQTAALRVTPSSKGSKAAADLSRQECTPPARPDTDEDLYGLSPEGEASKLRLETRRQSMAQQPPQSALKAQGTPAVETSILALANFKRRPRQPSIIRMVQQTSELGNQSDFDATLDETLRDFDEFNPDDESTPLHLNKRKSGGLSAAKSHRDSIPNSSSSRKRKHSDEEDDIQVPRSPILASSPPPIVARSLSDVHSTSSSSLPEHVIPSTEEADQDQAPGNYSDTMAPPRSSSELSPAPKATTTNARLDKRRKVATTTATRSPTNAKRRLRETKAAALSTAALQSLLPKALPKKRRAAKVDTYDIPSSDPTEANILEDSDDGDELAQTTRRRQVIRATARTPIQRTDGNRGRNKASEAARKTLKAPTPMEKQRRTYGRARPAESEKENDDTAVISDNGSDSGDEADVRGKKQRDSGVDMAASKELQEVRKKFEEVDEWEMEFESVDLGGGATSSPYR